MRVAGSCSPSAFTRCRRELGFVADARRLNVALTRAKCGIVVIGEPTTLTADAYWREYIAWVEREGLAARSVAQLCDDADCPDLPDGYSISLASSPE